MRDIADNKEAAARALNPGRALDLRTHPRARRLSLPALRAAEANGFYQRLSEDPFDDVGFVDANTQLDPSVAFAMIQTSARRLGDAWVDGSADFTDVTVKSSRLQTLLAKLRETLPPISNGPAIAVIAQPWDDHILGASLLEARLHKAGFATELFVDYTDEPLSAFDGVFLSASNLDRIAELEMLIEAVRKDIGPDTPIIVGGRISAKVTQIAGADLVTSSLIDALEFCAQHTKSSRFLI